MTLTELKARATELGLTPDDVRAYGSLAKKATWETAIAQFMVWKEVVDTHCEQMDIPQWSYPEDSVEDEPETIELISVTVNQEDYCHTCDNEGFISKLVSDEDGSQDYITVLCPSCYGSGIPQHTEETEEELPFEPTHTLIDGEWVEIEDKPVSNSVTAIHSSPIPPFEPMEGWHRWDEKLKAWVKENPEETLKDCYQPESEPYRQQLLKQLEERYLNDGLLPEDFEQLQHEPLDEHTAAICLGLLEESERMLKEALVA